MKSKLIAGILISLSIATVFFEIIEDPSGNITRSFIVPLLTSLLVLIYALGNELEKLFYEGCCAPRASVRSE